MSGGLLGLINVFSQRSDLIGNEAGKADSSQYWAALKTEQSAHIKEANARREGHRTRGYQWGVTYHIHSEQRWFISPRHQLSKTGRDQASRFVLTLSHGWLSRRLERSDITFSIGHYFSVAANRNWQTWPGQDSIYLALLSIQIYNKIACTLQISMNVIPAFLPCNFTAVYPEDIFMPPKTILNKWSTYYNHCMRPVAVSWWRNVYSLLRRRTTLDKSSGLAATSLRYIQQIQRWE